MFHRLDTSDREDIAELVNKWMLRDLGRWDELLEIFHPDGSIEVSWFEGRFSDFIEASKRMGKSNLRSKHLIGTPVIRGRGDRAISEVNAVIVLSNSVIPLGCDAHSRLFDLAERRDGVWKLLKRYCIYDMAHFTFPAGMVDIDMSESSYPREYAAMAFLLDRSGFPLKRIMPTRGSDIEAKIRAAADQWLEASSRRDL